MLSEKIPSSIYNCCTSASGFDTRRAYIRLRRSIFVQLAAEVDSLSDGDRRKKRVVGDCRFGKTW